MLDIHLHSEFSVDSVLKIEDIFRLKEKRKLKIVGISDHLDFVSRDQSYGRYSFDKIYSAVSPYFETFGRENVLVGAEITFQKKFFKEIKTFIDRTDVDYTIGSIHYVEDIIVSKWVIKNERKNLNKYFDTLADLVSSGLFNIVGHFDYFKKYISREDLYDENKYKEQFADIFDLMISKDVVLEVNTSGWRYFLFSPFPSLNMIKFYKERGGKLITIGSDSHRWYELGYRVKEIYEFLKEIGFNEIVFFRNKKIGAITL